MIGRGDPCEGCDFAGVSGVGGGGWGGRGGRGVSVSGSVSRCLILEAGHVGCCVWCVGAWIGKVRTQAETQLVSADDVGFDWMSECECCC